MSALLSFIISLVLLGIWGIGDKRDKKRVREMSHDQYYNKNMDRQMELYRIFSTGYDLEGKPITAPHTNPKDIQWLVKQQIEKEGYRYDNFLNWNLEGAVFNDKGEIISVGGYRVVRDPWENYYPRH